MSEKRKNGVNVHNVKKRRVITMETKVEIMETKVERHEKGNKFVDIARAY
jgi:hypothetical protein